MVRLFHGQGEGGEAEVGVGVGGRGRGRGGAGEGGAEEDIQMKKNETQKTQKGRAALTIELATY